MIHHGDLFDVLPTLAECSVDACVTDPPYGIGFMGKKWDGSGVAFRVETWREVFRVLKPGAYLAAFGGTRTYHRMTCAIEDAGFEIRDAVAYLYGSGFPKSLNINKAINARNAACNCDLLGVRNTADDAARMGETYEVSEVFQGVQRQGTRPGISQALAQGTRSVDGRQPTPLFREDERVEESGVEGRSDVLQEERQLQGHPVSQSASVGAADGAEGRLHHGASASDGVSRGATTHADRSRTSRRSRSNEQQAEEPGIVAGQQEPQVRGAWPLCDRCRKPMVPAGLGTALKPGYEPIVIARKPFTGTVAENVLQHGTAALNLDACRIDWAGEAIPYRHLGKPRINTDKYGTANPTLNPPSDLGRWPANVLLDEAAAAELDAMTGELVSGARIGGDTHKGAIYGERETRVGGFSVADCGGASRFYYVAKPSREERDYGCDFLQARTGGEATSRIEGSAGLNNPRAGAGRTGGARNVHPTVKPVELMRWLVKLVTPIGGTVLDPFLGSGTTGMAAAYELRPFIGIEREADYVRIAEARIKAVAPLFSEIA